MAATGNEAVRLEQLKRLQPQIVSFTNGTSAFITLGNGEVVTFSTTNSYNIHLLVRAMYNSFELLQATADGYNIDIKVTTEVPMKSLKAKTGTPEENDWVYGVTSGKISGELRGFDVPSGNKLNFVANADLIAFIGAVIYVE